jgi:hypothetical protein
MVSSGLAGAMTFDPGSAAFSLPRNVTFWLSLDMLCSSVSGEVSEREE